MRRYINNSLIQYALVAFLAIALLFGQAFKLHMHLQHDDIPSSSTAHVIGFHSAIEEHGESHGNHHFDTIVDVSNDNLAKSTNLLSSLLLILLTIGLFLFIPRKTSLCSNRLYKTLSIPCYYLFQPPLRAPPTN